MPMNPLPVLAPATPKKGLKYRFEHHNGSKHTWLNVSVITVNRRSFYASVGGNRERHLISEWETWLRDLCRRGNLFLGDRPVRLLGLSPSATFTPTREERAVLHKRLRSARGIAATYTIRRRADQHDRWHFEVEGGSRPYQVTVHPEWAAPPSCDCPDATNRQSPWCKHSLAVLMSKDDLRCQLLDLLMDAA